MVEHSGATGPTLALNFSGLRAFYAEEQQLLSKNEIEMAQEMEQTKTGGRAATATAGCCSAASRWPGGSEHGYRERPRWGGRICGPGPGASQGRLSDRHTLMDATTPAVVDTDVVSFLFKNHSLAQAYPVILAGRPLAVSPITLAEIEYGMEAKDWGAARRDLMRRFLTR